MTEEGFTLDHRTLAALAREVEEGDPIAWGDTALDRDTVYDLIASQIAEMFAGYETGGVGARPPAPRRAGDRGEAHRRELRPAPAADARGFRAPLIRADFAALQPASRSFRSSRRACRIGSV